MLVRGSVAVLALVIGGVAVAGPATAATTPSVTKVSPTAGKTAAGTRVTVTGTNFTHVKAVHFGTSSGTSIKVVSTKSLTVIAPKHAAGRVDVRIVTTTGTSAARTADHYTYVAAPIVTKVAPAVGHIGARVTVTGANFTHVTAVKFGTTTAPALTVVSSTKLLITAASHASGIVDVRVTSTYGTSPVSAKDRYTYDTTPPGPVTGLIATPTANSVGLHWTNPTAVDFAGVKICRGQGFTPSANCAALKNLSKPTTTFADTGLTELTQYTYAVFARDAVPNYALAATVTTTTPATDPTPPGPVTAVAATATSPTSIGLSWTNPSYSDFAGTRICRATGATAPTAPTCTAITTVAGPNAAFTDTGLNAGTQYSYALFAQDGVPNYALPVTAQATTPGFTSPGAIAGTVMDTSGHGLAKAVVQVTDSLGTALPAVLTASDGTYSVAGLVGASLYSICFTGAAATGGTSSLGYQPQCYDHQQPATATANFTAVPGQTVHGIDATLIGAAGLGGKITDTDGHPLGHVTVTHTNGSASTLSAVDGTYLLSGLPGGSVGVCFDPTGATGGTAGAAGYLNACTTKSLVSGRTITMNQSLTGAARVIGTVTDRAGNHLAGAQVGVYQDFSNPALGTATSAGNGAYQLTLNSTFDPTNVVNVCVLDPSGITGGVATGYEQGCVEVTLHSGLTVTGNVVLSPRGRIFGAVTDASGHPLANVHVSATDRLGSMYGVDTDAGGKYAVNVYVQDYTVCFDGSTATGGTDPNGYLFAQCYQGAPEDGSAPNVPVDAGQLVTVDTVLVAAAKVAGTVTDGAGHGVAGVVVKLDAPNGGTGTAAATDLTSASGNYILAALAPGQHTVCFDPSNATGGASTTGYLAQCYNAIAAGGTPTQLTLIPGQSAVANASLGAGGSISGKILDSAGKATSVPAQAYVLTAQHALLTTGTAAADGTYRINGLAPGTYYVQFGDVPANGQAPSIHVPQNWNAAALRHPPTAVVVTAAHVTVGINASLQNYEPIVGKVTDSAGNPLGGVQIEADYTDDGSQATGGVSNPNGTYALTSFLEPGVAPDSYTVHYGAATATGGASTTGYGDQVRSATVIDGQTKTLNVTMPTGGSITGTLTDSGGNPIQIGEVVVSQSAQVFADVFTSSDGTYAAGPLAPGGYTMCVTFAFGGTFTGYTPQCYNNVAPGGTPTPVTVTSGHTTANINAVLKGPGTISGTVTDLAGNPLAGVAVFAQTSGAQTPLHVDTDVDGTYSFASTALAGSYSVCFDAEAQSSGSAVNGYVDQCYNGIAPSGTPTPVVVTGEHATVNINAKLASAGAPQVAISGKVTDAGGHAISGVTVDISPLGSFYPPGSATTSALGTYSVTNLIPGPYSVCFTYPPTDNPDGSQTFVYYNQCYLNQAPGGSMTPVVVAAGHPTTAINATLAAFGSISGQVTDGAGLPLAGVTVAITPTDPNVGFGLSTQTDASGHYAAIPLLPGSYTVCFSADVSTTSGGAGDALGYVPQCYLNVAAGGAPTPVNVGDGAAVGGINAKLATYGGVSGTVTDSQGHGLSNILVFASDAASQIGIGSAATDASGHYSIPGLEAGSVSICFSVDFAPSGGSFDALGYVAQCYNGVATGGIPTNVTVTRGLNTPNVDAALGAFGGVSGTVKDSAAHPLSGVEVLVTESSTGTVVLDGESTDVNGHYQLTGLVPGNYTVCFAVNDPNGVGGPSDTFGYVGQCYNGVATGGTPTTTAVVSGAITANINATLTAFGAISGKVTDAAGHPLANVTVATAQDEQNAIVTDATGTYVLSQLVPGSYQLCFTPDASGTPASGGPSDPYGYQPQCYNGVAQGSPATTIVVVAGATTALAVNKLTAFGAISGTVTDGNGTHLSGVHVTVSPTGSATNTTDTDPNGGYSIGGVAPGGTYAICFDATDTVNASALGYLNRCYNSVAPGGSPTPVIVTAGHTTTVNQSLPIGGAVSGTVSDLHGGVANARVWAIATGTGAVGYTTTGGPSGSWTIRGLEAGSYRVCFYAATDASALAGAQTYVDQCYNNVAPGGTPTSVTVSAATKTTGINALLQLGG